MMGVYLARVKDIDLKSRNSLVFNGKGRKDRYTLIPSNLRENMKRQFAHVRAVHESDLADGFGLTSLPSPFLSTHFYQPRRGSSKGKGEIIGGR